MLAYLPSHSYFQEASRMLWVKLVLLSRYQREKKREKREGRRRQVGEDETKRRKERGEEKRRGMGYFSFPIFQVPQ